MAVQMTGLASGMDTQSIVAELMKLNKLKVDKVEKKKLRLDMKQEAWKELNTKIYNFYSKFASTMRLSSSYNVFKSSSSDDKKVSVVATNNAAAGNQQVEVKKLASAAYQTGTKVATKSGEAIKGSTKLVDLGVTAGQEYKLITGQTRTVAKETIFQDKKDEHGNVMLDGDGNAIQEEVVVDKRDSQGNLVYELTGGKETLIKVDENTTIDQFTKKLSDAGIRATFDTAQQRFFLNSKTSGDDQNFTLTVTGSAAQAAEIREQELKDAADAKLDILKQKFADAGIDDTHPQYANIQAHFDTIAEAGRYSTDSDVEYARNELIRLAGDNADTFMAGGNSYKYEVDLGTGYLTQDAKNAYEASGKGAVSSEEDFYAKWNDLSDEDKVIYTNDADGYEKFIKADFASIVKNEAKNSVQLATADYAKAAKISNAGVEEGADGLAALGMHNKDSVMGTNSEIVLNGATLTSKDNTYSVNGLSITAKEITTSAVSVTTESDTQGIYNKIKSFLTEYNSLMKEMSTLFNAASSGDYQPLTDEEKQSLSDNEIEKWDKKIKDSLLRRDDTIKSLTDVMKNAMMMSYKGADGKKYNLALFGITTNGYYAKDKDERNLYNIDGDADNATSSGRSDKLMKAIMEDPDGVKDFFSKLVSNVYTELDKKLKSSTSLKSAYSVYNDKQMVEESKQYNKQMAKLEELLKREEDRYYKQFTAMEKAMAKLNATKGQLGMS